MLHSSKYDTTKQTRLLNAAKSFGPYIWEDSSDVTNALLWFNEHRSAEKRTLLSSILKSKGLIFRASGIGKKRSFDEAFSSEKTETDANSWNQRRLSLLLGVLQGYTTLENDKTETASNLSSNGSHGVSSWINEFREDFLKVVKDRSSNLELYDIYRSLSILGGIVPSKVQYRSYWNEFDTRVSLRYAFRIMKRLIELNGNKTSLAQAQDTFLLDKLKLLALHKFRIREIFVMILFQYYQETSLCNFRGTKETDMLRVRDRVVKYLIHLSDEIMKQSRHSSRDFLWCTISSPLLCEVCSFDSSITDICSSNLIYSAMIAYKLLPFDVVASVSRKSSDTTGSGKRNNGSMNILYDSISRLKDLLSVNKDIRCCILLKLQNQIDISSDRYSEMESNTDVCTNPDLVNISKDIIACSYIASELGFAIDNEVIKSTE